MAFICANRPNTRPAYSPQRDDSSSSSGRDSNPAKQGVRCCWANVLASVKSASWSKG
jgi:hypothetical protein